VRNLKVGNWENVHGKVMRAVGSRGEKPSGAVRATVTSSTKQAGAVRRTQRQRGMPVEFTDAAWRACGVCVACAEAALHARGV
jgi:hypothetical protein